MPIAFSTCDCVPLFAAHALPVAIMTSRASSLKISRSASTPGNETWRKFARPFFLSDETIISGKVCSSSRCIASRRFRKRFTSPERRFAANSAATANPTTPATFSVPLLSPISCPPPTIVGRTTTPGRIQSNPTCFGP